MVSQVSRFFNQDYAPLYYAVQKEQTRLASDHEVRCVLEALRRGFDRRGRVRTLPLLQV